jgi:hypothetical protein
MDLGVNLGLSCCGSIQSYSDECGIGGQRMKGSFLELLVSTFLSVLSVVRSVTGPVIQLLDGRDEGSARIFMLVRESGPSRPLHHASYPMPL